MLCFDPMAKALWESGPRPQTEGLNLTKHKARGSKYNIRIEQPGSIPIITRKITLFTLLFTIFFDVIHRVSKSRQRRELSSEAEKLLSSLSPCKNCGRKWVFLFIPLSEFGGRKFFLDALVIHCTRSWCYSDFFKYQRHNGTTKATAWALHCK